jgi:hypothetical protein
MDDADVLRAIVHQPDLHARLLERYRLGAWACVVSLTRLLAELPAGTPLHTAMTVHTRDEERHARLFEDWIRRLGVEPAPLPNDVDACLAGDAADRARLARLPSELRRIAVLADVNALERATFAELDAHAHALDRAEDREALARVVAEERFHLSYVEHELGRQLGGVHAAFATLAIEQARARIHAATPPRSPGVAPALGVPGA